MKLRIDKPIYGGNGLARITEGEQAGKAVFVPYVLPGELVEARVSSSKKGFSEAELVQVIEPSTQRVAPKCRHFGVCGGCQYQHAEYAYQLEMKRTVLVETLQRAGVHDLPQVELHSAQPWQYRNRVRMRVEGGRIGYNRRASSAFLPITECPISAPLLFSAAQAIESLQLRDVSEVEFFCNAEESSLQITLFISKPVDLKSIHARLAPLLPELRGMGAVKASQTGRGHRDAPDDASEVSETNSIGESALKYDDFLVPRGAFFQTNRFLASELVRAATSGLTGSRMWDLYAGVGLFSSALLPHFESVIAVEIGEASYSSLAEFMRAAGKSHKAVRATTLNFLNRRDLETPGLVLADPPRAGLGKEVVERLNQIAAQKMVYVSCDPATLSRDLAGLLQSHYTLAELHLVDMFPQTFHLETVAVLKR